MNGYDNTLEIMETVKILVAQHKKLYLSVLAFEEVVYRRETGKYAQYLSEIMDIALDHFDLELPFLEQFQSLDEIKARKKEHMYFVSNISRFNIDYFSPSAFEVEKVLRFILSWVCGHIIREGLFFDELLSRQNRAV